MWTELTINYFPRDGGCMHALRDQVFCSLLMNQLKCSSKLSVIQNQLRMTCQEIRTLLPPLLLCIFSCVITRNRRKDGWKEGRKQRKVIKMECCRKRSVLACDHQMQLHWTGDHHGINRGLMLRRWWEKLLFCVCLISQRDSSCR